MKKDTYKILVLSDLKKSAITTLKSTVSLAKMINGEIDLFYVKNASEVIERENQLSAIRSINHDYTATDKKIKKIKNSVSDDYHLNINHAFAFGNVKHEIDKYIKESKPDIIVLGKKKAKRLNLIGDHITQFVLKQFSGTILIVDTRKTIEPNEELSLGILNNIETKLNTGLSKHLMAHTKKPIKSFNIVEKSKVLDKTYATSNTNTIDYVFEQNDNSIKVLSKYMSKTNINLLCIDRSKNQNFIAQNIKDTIDKLNVSLLFTS